VSDAHSFKEKIMFEVVFIVGQRRYAVTLNRVPCVGEMVNITDVDCEVTEVTTVIPAAITSQHKVHYRVWLDAH
jgi:hypothetical protein